MKLWKTILIVAPLLIMIPAALFAATALTPPVYDETYYAELSDLYTRLKTAEGNRLIVVGNSDVAFGTNGELLETLLHEKGYDYTVCPFGLYGAIGTAAMVELCRSELREGDLVVFVVEPVSDVLTSYFGATAYLKCAESDYSLLLPVTNEMKTNLVGNLVPYLQERFSFILAGEKPHADGAYIKAAFNDRCDMVYDRPGNIMRLGYDTSAPIDFAAVTIEEEFADSINELIKKADSVGAAVTVSFSPMNRSAITSDTDESLLQFFRLVNETFSCPVISDPNDYILDNGWFYDTNLHLNNAGTEVRTVLLAEDLLAYFGCRAPIDCALPEMPASAAAQTKSTEGDTDAFIYEPLTGADAYLVTGLTESGMASESLTVPSVYEDKPVVGIADGALRGAEALRELTLPDSIETIGDAAFEGDDQLERLVILHRSTVPTVTDHTFDGADRVRVFVPAEDYPMYRDGVGCTVNPWEIYLDRIVSY